MRKRRFLEEQIIKILKQAEARRTVGDVCRDHGISPKAFYRSRKELGGLEGWSGWIDRACATGRGERRRAV